MKKSKGFPYSVGMLVFMLIELGVFFDIESRWANDSVQFLFAGLALLTVLQLAGILLVWAGHYRVGGVLQICASAVHVLDVMGLLGIVGGMRAYRYPERPTESARPALCAPD
jgi:hypothetical protein